MIVYVLIGSPGVYTDPKPVAVARTEGIRDRVYARMKTVYRSVRVVPVEVEEDE